MPNASMNGAVRSWPHPHARHSPAPQPQAILLIHPGALGDLVQAIPAFAAVRTRFPDAQLGLVVGDDVAGFARQLTIFDAVYPFDAAVAYHGRVLPRLLLLAALTAKLRRTRPDCVGVFKAASAYAALAWLTGARRCVGLTRGVGRRFLTSPITPAVATHRADQYAAVAHALGATVGGPTVEAWPLTPIPPDIAALRTGGTFHAVVAVGPGGGRNTKENSSAKRWTASKFANALLRVADLRPVTAIVLGGASDRGEADALLAALAGRVHTIDLVGRTSIVEARAVIAASDAYLGNDSALMHVAGTTPTPIIAVFGPTDPRVLAPLHAHVVWKPARARPCRDEVGSAVLPCVTPCCIDRVDTSDVVAALCAVLCVEFDSRMPAGRASGNDVGMP